MDHDISGSHDTPIAAKRKKTVWGRWYLDEEKGLLRINAPHSKHFIANIGLPLFWSRCTEEVFNAWLGSWLQDVHAWREMSYKDVWDFIDAAQDIHVYHRVAR
jgi:hypothetical protein